MPLEDEVEKYIKALDKFVGTTKLFSKMDMMTFKFKNHFVSFARAKEGDFEYILTLPLHLKDFNEKLSSDDALSAGEAYIPPAPIVSLLDNEHCNAGKIFVEDELRGLNIYCESYGFVVGFLRFYGKNF